MEPLKVETLPHRALSTWKSPLKKLSPKGSLSQLKTTLTHLLPQPSQQGYRLTEDNYLSIDPMIGLTEEEIQEFFKN